MFFCQLEDFRVIDEDLTDVRAQIITKRTNDNVAFLMDQEWRRAAFSGFLDRIPMLKTESQVPLQSFCGFTDTGSTHNQAHAIRQLQGRQGFFQFSTVIAFNTAGNTPCAWIVWHQYQITTGQTDKRRQCCAFISTLFFIYLNNDFLAFAQHIFDVRAAMGRIIAWEIFAGNFFQRRKPCRSAP
ncbi:hypothetical protein SRABI106_04275 [Rahnella aquatilis]|nr:hypothetical protein SRABI106_04275 [Rahnella aquatilis]